MLRLAQAAGSGRRGRAQHAGGAHLVARAGVDGADGVEVNFLTVDTDRGVVIHGISFRNELVRGTNDGRQRTPPITPI